MKSASSTWLSTAWFRDAVPHNNFYRSRFKPTDDATPAQSTLGISGESAYQSLKAAQVDIGMSRFRMGAILCVMEAHDAWQGKTSAKSFHRFIAEEGIEPKAAHQYMKVARRFVLELQLTDRQLEKIAPASMRALVDAADVADASNIDNLIGILVTLPRQEAIEAIKAVARPDIMLDQPLVKNPPLSQPVKKVMAQFDDMTMVQRAELYAIMRLNQSGVPPAQSASFKAATMQVPIE